MGQFSALVLLVSVGGCTLASEVAPGNVEYNADTINGLMARMSAMERKLQLQSDTERDLRLEIENLKRDLREQREQFTKLQESLDEKINARCNCATSDVDSTTKLDIDEVDIGLQDTTQALLKSVPAKRFLAEASSNVAFSAYLDHDLNNLGAGQTVLFDRVLLNDGNAYNHHSGVFTCPVTGVYLFSFFLGIRDVMQTYAHLMVNSTNMVEAVAEGYHNTQDLQGGNVAIFKLNQGDIVKVTVYVGNHVEGSTKTRLSTFSGALLYPL